ncbi:Crp/Fnr family transcriptional regulator [Actinokineospora spheciospongiae]|uniref:Crp/Fnr family transcriptional regulator n=1 Tax=Actinokineospora spheciospongiae TaxID=909613 RepID=UPI000D709828|nr:Crp/Fnr family transcriptional regulator [Actinokineospora spheciospongiae]PWW65758.1 CRP-like cAMP-binding protein [Actinokineospora spheciospongiae]
MDIREANEGTFWALLDPEQRGWVRAAATARRFEPGDVLIREGDRGDWVLVLASGRVKVVAAGPAGHAAVLAVRGPGDILGEMAALDGSPRSATVTAVEPVVGLHVPGERFSALLVDHPAVAAILLRIVTSRLRYANQRRMDHADAGTARRLAALLLELHDRYGRRAPDGVTITLRVTQSDLAGLISASREAVTRALRPLRDRGVLTTGRQRLVIHDVEALRRAAR